MRSCAEREQGNSPVIPIFQEISLKFQNTISRILKRLTNLTNCSIRNEPVLSDTVPLRVSTRAAIESALTITSILFRGLRPQGAAAFPFQDREYPPQDTRYCQTRKSACSFFRLWCRQTPQPKKGRCGLYRRSKGAIRWWPAF